MRPLLTAIIGAIVLASAAAASADPVWDKVGEVLGKSGTEMPGGVYRIALPRTDIKATLDGVDLKPGFALGGWLAFQKTGDAAMVMGDLVLTAEEVKPVMAKLLATGIAVTALHNHLLRNQPFTMYMHVYGHGDAVKLATALHNALLESKTPLVVGAPAPAAPPPIDLDTAALDQILGAKGTNNGGVYGFRYPARGADHRCRNDGSGRDGLCHRHQLPADRQRQGSNHRRFCPDRIGSGAGDQDAAEERD